MNRKWVTLASDVNQSYDFLLPVGGLVWRKVTGYEPLCLLAGSDWNTPAGQVVIKQLDSFGMRHEFVGEISEPYRTSVHAQMSRQHVACLDLPEDDLIMTGDADMMPIDGEWFNRWDSSKAVRLHYSNSYGYRFHTTGYWTMKVKTWREVMRLEVTGNIAGYLQDRLDRYIGRDRDTFQEWYADEHIASVYLKAWHGYPDQCMMIEREGAPPMDRLDRGNWHGKLKGMVDAHVLRPAQFHANWYLMRPFLEQLIPEHMDSVEKFREWYLEAMG